MEDPLELPGIYPVSEPTWVPVAPRRPRLTTEMMLALLLGVMVVVAGLQAVQLADLRGRLQTVVSASSSAAASASIAQGAVAGGGAMEAPAQRGGC